MMDAYLAEIQGTATAMDPEVYVPNNLRFKGGNEFGGFGFEEMFDDSVGTDDYVRKMLVESTIERKRQYCNKYFVWNNSVRMV